MIDTTVTINNKAGLHARAAAKLVSITTTFCSKIEIGHESKMVDGKSILSVMMLAACCDTTLKLVIEGKDEEKALQAIEQLIDNRFDENE